MGIGYQEALALLPGVPAFENPLFDASWRDAMGEPAFSAACALRDHGYAEIDLVQPDFAALCDGIRTGLEPRFDWPAWRSTGAADMRLQDAWAECGPVGVLAANPGVLALLSTVYGRDCLYLTPMHSNPGVGPLALRRPLDVRTGQAVPNGYLGVPVDEDALARFSALVPRREAFDAGRYLALNPDVAAAGVDAYEHYVQTGRFEHRRVS